MKIKIRYTEDELAVNVEREGSDETIHTMDRDECPWTAVIDALKALTLYCGFGLSVEDLTQ